MAKPNVLSYWLVVCIQRWPAVQPGNPNPHGYIINITTLHPVGSNTYIYLALCNLFVCLLVSSLYLSPFTWHPLQDPRFVY